ncbi:fimbrial chaperone protein [Citrobacter youngae]|nr:fimbrial chaperone protein [Citrobacter youngae]
MKWILIAFLIASTQSVHAGIVIYGTRIIYPAEKNEVLVQLMNQGERSSLVQSWIDDGDTLLPPEKIQVPFLLTPPVVKVAGDSGQQLKIKKMPNTLPNDKESLFFLMYWIFHRIILIAPEKMYSNSPCRIELNFFIGQKVLPPLIKILSINWR